MCFFRTSLMSSFQALWNLSERIGLAKARGLSKEGKKSCFYSMKGSVDHIFYNYQIYFCNESLL